MAVAESSSLSKAYLPCVLAALTEVDALPKGSDPNQIAAAYLALGMLVMLASETNVRAGLFGLSRESLEDAVMASFRIRDRALDKLFEAQKRIRELEK